MAKIIILSGPAKGLEYQISDRAILGRQSDNSVPLQDIKASRQHTLIFLEEDYYYIEDLQSRNGTLVNNKPVTRQRLFHQDHISIGSTILLFESKKHQRPAFLDDEQQLSSALDEPSTNEAPAPQEILTLDRMLQKMELVPTETAMPELPRPQLRQDGILRSRRKERKPRFSPIGGHWLWSFMATDFSTNSPAIKVTAVLLLLLLMAVITMVARWLTLAILN